MLPLIEATFDSFIGLFAGKASSHFLDLYNGKNQDMAYDPLMNKFSALDAYRYSYNALVNLFWQPVEGASLGIEFANGQRFDKGPFRGHANRLSALIYYDF